MASQHRKSAQDTPQTQGGQKLKELRQRTGISLMELTARLETEHGKLVDVGHINRIETGKITKPQIETLETILAGLGASYGDRRAVLESFGYRLPMVLPSLNEIEDVRGLTVHELDNATYPMLLIDFGHRLLAWNRYAPRLIGLHPDDPITATYIGVTTFDLVFNPSLGGRLLVENPEEFWPAWLHLVKSGLYMFREDQWYREIIEKTGSLPDFRDIWNRLPQEPVRLVKPLNIVPLKLNVPGVGVLQFRLSPSEFLLDTRFQFIHFTPYGADTMRVCAKWAEEEGIF